MKYAVLSILAVILLAGVLLIIKSALFRVIKTEENCSASGEKKWDGTALTNDTVTVSAGEGNPVGGFVTGEGATYNVTLIRPVVRGKVVLELAAGTGMIARNIVSDAKMVEATDSSYEMIEEAKRLGQSSKLYFSVQDIFNLPYADGSFDVIIASNVLHIIPEPEKALAEIKRVMSKDGILIAPTFTHAKMGIFGKLKAGAMKLFGFPLHSKWSPDDYLEFLKKNGLAVVKSEIIKASFPLTYVECKKL